MKKMTVVTLNDDYTSRRTDVRRAFRHRARAVAKRLGRRLPRRRVRNLRPLALLVQEAKNTPLGAILPPGSYGVAHDRSSAARAGVAVVWDVDQASAVGDQHHRVLCEPRGAAMLPRGVTWQTLRVDGEPIVFASTHRPPERYDWLWPEFDRNLRAWVAEQRHPVVLGIDTNVKGWGWQKPGRRRRLARSMGMRQRGRGIDAVFVTPPLRVSRPRWLPRWTSDHRGVEVRVRVGR